MNEHSQSTHPLVLERPFIRNSRDENPLTRHLSAGLGSSPRLGDIPLLTLLQAQNLRTIHLVFPTYKRWHAFEEGRDAILILHILKNTASQHCIMLHEATAMPEHLHILASFGKHRHIGKDVTKHLKGASSREFNKVLGEPAKHLWASGKHFEEITTQKQLEKTLHYIRENPSQAHLSPHGRILSQLHVSPTPATS
jgi:REP element-mobilizing transposase RayT